MMITSAKGIDSAQAGFVEKEEMGIWLLLVSTRVVKKDFRFEMFKPHKL